MTSQNGQQIITIHILSINIVTLVKHSHPYISYMSNERLQGEDSFQSKNHFLEIPPTHAKVHLKSAPQKLNFLMVKAIQKVIHQIVATNALAHGSQTMKFGQLIEYNMRMVFLEKSFTKCGGEANPTLKIESKSKLSTSLDQQCEML